MLLFEARKSFTKDFLGAQLDSFASPLKVTFVLFSLVVLIFFEM